MTTPRIVRALAIAGLVVVSFVLVWMLSIVADRIATVLTIVVFSIFFSYLIYPAVKWLSLRMPRALAVVVVYAAIFLAVLAALAFLAPTVIAQAEEFSQTYPTTVRVVQSEIANPKESPLLARLPAQLRDLASKNAGKIGTFTAAAAGAIGSRIVPFLSGSATLVTELAIMFGVTFMLIGDLEKIQETLLRMFPRDRRPGVISLVVEIDEVIGGYVRTQAILAVSTAVASIVVLVLMGVPYAVLLGVVIGVFSFVPSVGSIVGAIPAVFVAFFTIGIVKAIVVVVLLAVIFQVIGNLVAPLLNAKSVGVSPLIVTLAILVGGEAFGILGILLSVPIAGILRVVYDRLFPPDAHAENLVIAARAETGDVTQPQDLAPSAPAI